MTFGQRDIVRVRQMAAIAQALGNGFAQHLRMTRRRDAIREHAMKRHVGTITREPERDRAEGLRHAVRADHGEHRHVERGGEIGAAGRAVEEAHHAFDQDQIGIARGLRRAARGTHRARPSTDAANTPATPHARSRIIGSRKSGPVLKTRTRQAAPRVMARERGRDRGLALMRRACADEESGAVAASRSELDAALRLHALLAIRMLHEPHLGDEIGELRSAHRARGGRSRRHAASRAAPSARRALHRAADIRT